MSAMMSSHGVSSVVSFDVLLGWRAHHNSQAISDAAALVSGPSLMALAHLARKDGPARGAIAEANGGVPKYVY